jgi:hypothetical protein
MWTVFGIVLLLLNVMFIVIDVKNKRLRNGTLLNAFAAGVIMMSILNAMNAQ